MNTQVLTALVAPLVALASVPVSMIASVIVAGVTAGHRLKSARNDLTISYSTKLLDARITSYPELYCLVSEFNKHIEGGSERYMTGQRVTRSDVQDLLRAIVAWDNKSAIFLSQDAADRLFMLRIRLINLIEHIPPAKNGERLPINAEHDLLSHAQRLELALKKDLGIFEVELYEKRTPYESYKIATMDIRSKNHVADAT